MAFTFAYGISLPEWHREFWILVAVAVLVLVATAKAELVANWTFDEGSGGYANDSTAFGNNCTISNATWASGVKGSALEFNGFDSYLDCGNESSLNFGSDNFTIMAWVKISMNQQGEIIVKVTDSADDGYDLYAWNDLTICSDEAGTLSAGDVCTTTPYDDGTWHFIAVVVNQTDYSRVIYFDGIKEAEEVNDVGAINSINNLTFGYNSEFIAQYFNGTIDEVKMWNEALSGTQILEIYNDESPTALPSGYSPVYTIFDYPKIIIDLFAGAAKFLLDIIAVILIMLLLLFIGSLLGMWSR